MAGLVLAAGLAGAVAARADLEKRAVSFSAADGFRIAADYYRPTDPPATGAPVVILLHMYKSDRTAWQPLLQPLHDAGFAVLAVDLRGHGESATTETRERVERRDTTLFREMQADLRGAYDWLAGQPQVDRARFALVGASVGCSVALEYAAQDRSVDGVVCLSPGLNYLGLDSAGDIHQITGRRLLLLATEDERDAVYSLKERNADAQTQIFTGRSAHGTNMFGVVDKLEERLVAFLKEAVGAPAKSADLVYASINSRIYHTANSGWLAEITPTNLRVFSSAREAEARGLRASRSKTPGDRGRGTRR